MKRVLALDGDATDESTLEEAGIDHARALLSTLPVDADNVYVTLTARQLNPSLKIISRANLASSKAKMIRAGADHVLVPENIGGFYMSALVTKPDIIRVFSDLSGLEDRKFRMAEIILESLPPDLTAQTIGDMNIFETTGANVIGMKTPAGDFIVNPPSDTPLQEGIGILVVGNEAQIKKFHERTKAFTFIE